MAEIIYGSELSAALKEEMRQEVASYAEAGYRRPHLDVILAGDNPASLSYIKGKRKAAEQVGIDAVLIHLPEHVTQQELDDVIRECNENEASDGILVQLPLPKGLDENEAIAMIDPAKDVDGLHPVNVGKMYLGLDGMVPCTPLGIMEILKQMGCNPDGKRAVVVGRSKLVGAPVARLLQNRNATVTICHSHTKDLAQVCREADILIAAIGKPKFFTADYVKEGAFVIDVGVNRTEEGKLCGDVDFEAVKDKCAAITPVPKGVGPMTICMLMHNTLKAYKEKLGL